MMSTMVDLYFMLLLSSTLGFDDLALVGRCILDNTERTTREREWDALVLMRAMHGESYLISGAAKLDEARGLLDVADGSPLNWNGALLVGAVAAAAPKEKEGVAPKLNGDGIAPNAGGAAPEADAAMLENAKPVVAPTDGTGAGLTLLVGAVVFEVPPKLNSEEFDEPKVGNGEAPVTGLSSVEATPNEAVEPKADGTVELLDEITGGANVFGGLLAPNAN